MFRSFCLALGLALSCFAAVAKTPVVPTPIAHDLPVVRDFADHVMVMQKGHVVELGTVREVFEMPREDYTRALLAAGLDPDPDVQAAHRAARLARAS